MNNFKYIFVILWCSIGWGNASQEKNRSYILSKNNLMRIILDYLTIDDSFQFIQSNTQTYGHWLVLPEVMHTQYQQFLERSQLPIAPLSPADIRTLQKYCSFLRRNGMHLAIPHTPLVFFQSYDAAIITYPDLFCSDLWRDRPWVEKQIRDFYQANLFHFEVSEAYENGTLKWGYSKYAYGQPPRGGKGLPLVHDPHSNHLYLFFSSNFMKKTLRQRQHEYNAAVGIKLTEHPTSIAMYLQLPVMLIFVHDDYQDCMHIERLSEWSCNNLHCGNDGTVSGNAMWINNKSTQHCLALYFNEKGGIERVYLTGKNCFSLGFKDDIRGLYTAKLKFFENSGHYTIETLRALSIYTTVYAFYHGIVDAKY